MSLFVEYQAVQIGILVLINVTHVLFHLLAARVLGISVDTVSLGFGRTFWSTQRGGTTYRVAIPIGLFVRLKSPVRTTATREIPANKIRYEEAGALRQLVVAMGPLIGLALLGYSFAFLHEGKPACETSKEPVVEHVRDDSAAAEAGLETGDRILAINGSEISSFQELADRTAESSGEPIDLQIQRGEEHIRVEITPQYDDRADRYLIGVSPGYAPTMPPPFLKRAESAAVLVVETAQTLVDGIRGHFVVEGGPVMVGTVSCHAPCGEEIERAQEARTKLLLAVVYCMQIFVFCLLPGPFFDGRRIVFVLLAAVFPRPGIYKFEWWYDRVLGALFFLLVSITLIWVVAGDALRLLEL